MTSLIGRDAELAVLDDCWARTQHASGCVVFVEGEAGIGKTALVESWRENIFTSHPPGAVCFASATCRIGARALQPWADLVVAIQAQTSTTRVAPGQAMPGKAGMRTVARETIPHWLRAIPIIGYVISAIVETRGLAKEQKAAGGKLDIGKLLRDSAPDWAWALPVVGDVAHAAVETARLVREQSNASAAPETAFQQQVLQEYVSLLTAIAAELPLILFLDDAHLADQSTTNLLFYLHRQVTQCRILVIVAYRTDEALAANEGRGHEIITVKNEIFRYSAGREILLQPLTAAALRTLAEGIAPALAKDEGFDRWLNDKASGNPFVAISLMHTANKMGAHDDASRALLQISEDIGARIESRMRSLAASDTELLQCATVQGIEFNSHVLSRLTRIKTLELMARLKDLERRNFIRVAGTTRVLGESAMQYAWVRPLERDHLYRHLNRGDRVRFHRACLDIYLSESQRADLTATESKNIRRTMLAHAEGCDDRDLAARFKKEIDASMP